MLAAGSNAAVVEGWLQRAPPSIRDASLRAQLEHVVTQSREACADALRKLENAQEELAFCAFWQSVLQERIEALPSDHPRVCAAAVSPPHGAGAMSSLPSYARSLNEQQRRAALAPIDAPLLVLAGAGSGKTGVMAARVQHILASGVPPASVLALTFTRAAETAIRERLTASVGVRVAKALRVATFHSLALSICREFAAALEGGTADFALVTGAQQVRLVTRALVEYRIARAARPSSSSSSSGSSSPDAPDASRALRALLHAKARGGRAEGVADEALRFVWAKYDAWQRERNGLDMVDLVRVAAEVVRTVPAARGQLRKRHSHILAAVLRGET